MGLCKSGNKDIAIAKPPEWAINQASWIRLEDQINWYDKKSKYCQRWYKWLKFLQIVLAVSIPIMVHISDPLWKWMVSFSGALIAVIEAIDHMNQYATLWVMYRSTAERLKHEKYLFLAAAGPYRNSTEEERIIILAERVEEHVSTEHANWFNETQHVIIERKKGNNTG
ncbi:MAG: DUF4231 domain-containing protein [Smithellaceae bacterium]